MQGDVPEWNSGPIFSAQADWASLGADYRATTLQERHKNARHRESGMLELSARREISKNSLYSAAEKMLAWCSPFLYHEREGS